MTKGKRKIPFKTRGQRASIKAKEIYSVSFFDRNIKFYATNSDPVACWQLCKTGSDSFRGLSFICIQFPHTQAARATLLSHANRPRVRFCDKGRGENLPVDIPINIPKYVTCVQTGLQPESVCPVFMFTPFRTLP